MDPQEFITYLNDPNRLGKHSLADIESLAGEFPYCQSLRILYLLNLRMTNQVMFSEQLKTTAAYIADRKRLRELVAILNDEHLRKEHESKEQETVKDKSELEEPADVDQQAESSYHEQNPVDQKKPEPIVPVIEQDEEARLLALKKIVEERLSEITKEKKKSDETTTPDETGEKQLSKEEIINKFIEEEPTISRPKTDFFDPVKVARKSQIDTDGLVSETLARIHIHQGNIEKAIEIYRKLSLKFPEKSSYFAAQIEKINTEN
ncbi:MAG: hypothetical protein RQ761_07880 [Bacteroidales bacterium]|nr:hypothetical protein [Bacteroidales bacterium]